MRAAIYARVSSSIQREAHSVDSQLLALRSYAKSQGWTVVGEYVDDGRSAKTGALDKREAFARLQADARAKAFDVLLVVDVDRLTRTNDFQERARILGPFQEHGIDIVTPTGGRHDMRSMLGEMYVTFRAMFAAEENRAKSERITRGIERACTLGRKPKGRTPYGHAYDRASGRWSLDHEAAEVVREAFRRLIGGEPIAHIADDLNTRGVRGPTDGPWTRGMLRMIIVSRRCVGEWTAHKGKRLVIAVPPIVDEATWQKAQGMFARTKLRGLRKTKHVYLLEDMGLCAACGASIHIRSDKNRKYAKYICRTRKHGGHCETPLTQVDQLDERVWATVRREIEDPDLAVAIQRKMEARSGNRGAWAADAKKYRAKLDRLVHVERSVLARFRSGAISDAALDAELAAIRSERATFETQLQAAEAGARDTAGMPEADAETWLRELRALVADDSPQNRRRLVRAVLKPGSVIFDGDRVRFVLLVQCRPVGSTVARSDHGTAMEIRCVA